MFDKLILLTTISLAATITMVASIEFDGCLCPVGSKPGKDTDGLIKCWTDEASTNCLTTIPKCICSGRNVQVFENDEVLVCSTEDFQSGIKKWPCENRDDWLLYLSAKKDNDNKQAESKDAQTPLHKQQLTL